MINLYVSKYLEETFSLAQTLQQSLECLHPEWECLQKPWIESELDAFSRLSLLFLEYGVGVEGASQKITVTYESGSRDVYVLVNFHDHIEYFKE